MQAAFGGAARARADATDAVLRAGTCLGPLHGIPYGLKDLFDTKKIPTTWGAMPYKARVPDSDALIVRRLNGAVRFCSARPATRGT